MKEGNTAGLVVPLEGLILIDIECLIVCLSLVCHQEKEVALLFFQMRASSSSLQEYAANNSGNYLAPLEQLN